MRKYLLFFFVSAVINFGTAQITKESSNRIESSVSNPVSIASGSITESVDADNTTLPSLSSVIHQNLMRLNFGFNEKPTTVFATTQRVEVEVKCSALGFLGQNIPLGTHFMEVTFDPDYNGVSHARLKSLNFQDLSAFRFTFELLGIKVNGVAQNTLPLEVYLQSEIITERYNMMDISSSPNLNFGLSLDGETIDDQCIAGKEIALDLKWSGVSNAQEYQLEWQYINDYSSTDLGTPLTQSNLIYDFAKNSTRITTSDLSYKLNLVFDRGWVVFRIRALGVKPNDPNKIVYGDWSVPTRSNVLSLSSNHKIRINDKRVHEPDLNWQYSATFAEEGKSKEVITYFDGSLRNRQMVTSINSDEHVIVGETIYDFEGRPVINVLPTPAYCDTDNESNGLRFYPEFNQAQGGTAYTFQNFDPDGGTCLSPTDSMITASGASKYYSTENPEAQGGGIQGYVPDAEGYPFTQVQYTSDNTGRIRNQSGVGSDFKLGSGHETKYLYGVPNQLELDRLFGSEVGYAVHYSKNAVIDPNGQVSISYQDQEERVIATALAGDSPNNLEALESLSNPAILTVSAIDDAQDQKNEVNFSGDGYEYIEKIILTNPTEFKVDYGFNIESFIEACVVDVCFQCQYDLSIQLLDECGVNVLFISGVGGVATPNELNTIVGQMVESPSGDRIFEIVGCNSISNFMYTQNLTSNVIEAGEYTLVKTLRINSTARDEYIRAILESDNPDCVKSLDQFEQEELSKVDSTLCNPSCSECLEELGTLASYLAAERGTRLTYQQSMEDCQALCIGRYDDLSDISIALGRLMEIDMSPGGQYAEFMKDGVIDPSAFPLSIFNSSNSLPSKPTFTSSPGSPQRFQWRNPQLREPNGQYRQVYLSDDGQRSRIYLTGGPGNYTPQIQGGSQILEDPLNNQKYTYPENLVNAEDFFSTYWESSWAKSLIYYHPEYAYYLTYLPYNDIYGDQLEFGNGMSSNFFDDLLLRTETFQDAVLAGLIKPTFLIEPNNSVLTDWFVASADNDSRPFDPFVANMRSLNDFSAYHAQIDEFKDVFEEYFVVDGEPISMVEFAAYTARCNPYSNQLFSNCFSFGKGLSDEVRDKEWKILRSLYISAKEEYKLKIAHKIVVNGNVNSQGLVGFNGCIEKESFNPFSPPMAGYLTPWNLSTLNGTQFSNPEQPCNCKTYTLYSTKRKLFIDAGEYKSQETADVYFQHYQRTGQCPQTLGVQEVLKELTNNGELLAATPVSLIDMNSFGQLYQYINGFEFQGTPPDAFHSRITSANPSEFKFKWTDQTNSAPVTLIEVTLLRSSSLPWAVVEEFVEFKVYQNGAIKGKVRFAGSGVLEDITGTLDNNTYELTGCQFPKQNNTSQLVKDIHQVLTVLEHYDDRLVTNQQISLQPYSPSATFSFDVPESIKSYLGQSVGVVFNNINSEEFQIYSTNNVSKKIVVQYSQTSDVAPNVANAFDHFIDIETTGNSSFEQTVMVGSMTKSLYGSISLMEGANQKGIQTGYEHHPLPVRCQGEEFERMLDFEALLEDVLVHQGISANHDSPRFSESALFYNRIKNDMGGQNLQNSQLNYTVSNNRLTFTINGCQTTIEPSPNQNLSNFNYQSILELSDFDFDPNDLGPYGVRKFTMLAKVPNQSISQFSYITLEVESCLDLRICKECEVEDDPDPNPPGDDSVLAYDHERTSLVLDFTGVIPNYEQYRDAIKHLNDENGLNPGDSLYVETNSVARFILSGGAIFVDTRSEYTNHMLLGLDEVNGVELTGGSQNFSYGVDLREELSSFTIYSDLAQIVGDHNITIAQAAGQSGSGGAYSGLQGQIDMMDFATFMKQHYADTIREYSKTIWAMEDTLRPNAQQIEVVVDPPSFTQLEDSLYEIYYDVTMNYINANVNSCRIPELETLSELKRRNTFCSADALANFNLYVSQMQNFESCPTYLDYYSGCIGDLTINLSRRVMSEYAQLVETVQNTEDQVHQELDSRNITLFDELYLSDNVPNSIPLEFPRFDRVLADVYRGDPCEGYVDDDDNGTRPIIYDSYDLVEPFVRTIPSTGDPLPRTNFSRFVEDVVVLVADNRIDTTSSIVLAPNYDHYGYPCDTFYQEPTDWCSEVEIDFSECINELVNFTFTQYPGPRTDRNGNAIPGTPGVPDTYSERYNDLGGDYPNSICYCADEYCSRVYNIIHGIEPFTSYQDIIDYVYPSNFCEEKVNYCEDSLYQDTVGFEPYTVEIKDPCIEFQIGQAKMTAQNAYSEYVDSMINALAEKYNSHCMGVEENMSYQYTDQQYHYTLYYYDQAGNLIKTVPPAGVRELPFTSSTDPLSQQIISDRQTHKKTVVSSHQMATTYEYNSLNQLIYQNTPDTDPIDIFELTSPNGLSTEFTSYKVEMINEQLGYLGGEKNGRGLLYKTTDGGKVWNRVKDFVSSDLKAIAMKNALEGVAVGFGGTILKTVDGGISWDVVSSFVEGEMSTTWNDVIYTGSTYCFAGNNLVYAESNDLVNFTVYSTLGLGNPLSDDFVSLYFEPNSQKVMVLMNSEGLDGTISSSVHSKSINQTGWQSFIEYSSNGFLDADITNGEIRISGIKGQLYSGEVLPISSQERYSLQPTATSEDIAKVRFTNDDFGVALMGTGSSKGLYRTINGGQTWDLIDENHVYKTIEKSRNGQVVMAAGDVGSISMVPESAGFPAIADKIESPFSGMISALWVEPNVQLDEQFTMLVAEGTTLAFTQNGNQTSPSWELIALSTQLQNSSIKKMRFRMTPIYLYGTILVESGKLFYLRYTLSDGTIFSNQIGSFSDFVDFDSEVNADWVFATRNNAPTYTVMNYSVNVSGASMGFDLGGISYKAQVRSISNDELLLVSETNKISRANLVGLFAGLTADLTSKDNHLLSERLNVIAESPDGSIPYVLGGDGQVFIFDSQQGGLLKKVHNTITDDIQAHGIVDGVTLIGGSGGFISAIEFINGTSPQLISDEGNINFGGTNGEFGSFMPNVTITSIDGYVDNQSIPHSHFYAGIDNGSVLVGSKLASTATEFTSTFKSSVSNESILDLAVKPNTEQVLLVGGYASITEVQGSFFKKRNRIYPRPIIDLDFDGPNNGVILAQDYFIRTYSGSTNKWTTVVPNFQINAPLTVQPFNKVLAHKPEVHYAIGQDNRIIFDGSEMQASNFAATNTGTAILERSDESIVMATTQNGNNQIVVVSNSTTTPVLTATGASSATGNTQVNGVVNDFALLDNDSYVFVTSTGYIYYNSQDHSNRFEALANGTNQDLRGVHFIDRTYGVIVGENGLYLRSNVSTPDVDANGYLNSISFIAKTEVFNTPANVGSITNASHVEYNTVDFSSSKSGFIGGTHTPLANKPISDKSANFLVFDPNLRFSSRFFYDRLGRLVVSQNARQFPSKYSYTLYDELGRVVEVGEKSENPSAPFDQVFGTKVGQQFTVSTIDDTKLNDWVVGNGERKEVTRTYYDQFDATIFSDLPLNFSPEETTMRKRIAHVAYYAEFNPASLHHYDHATHYSYDIHGNVKTLIQDNRNLAFIGYTSPAAPQVAANRFKRMDYSYDLISGNVHRMSYQFGERDQWHHAYEYDADNRIVSAFTNANTPLVPISRSNVLAFAEIEDNADWKTEATYEYYDHGPLARTETGRVGGAAIQGCDYVYNIQGWLKGVNSTATDSQHDPGKDGDQSITSVPTDLMGFNLHYFNGDYKAVNGVHNDQASAFYGFYDQTVVSQNSSDLYNGNIRSMQTTIKDLQSQTPMFMANAYRYDQLNRLIESRSFKENFYSTQTNSWASNGTSDAYFNKFKYDANGNILEQLRNDGSGVTIDSLHYKYHTDSNGKPLRNRLYHLRDQASLSGNAADDLEDMGAFVQDDPNTLIDEFNSSNNYVYDQEGRLIEDKSEEIEIDWRVDGKVRRITDNSSGPQPHKYLDFEYDAMGNRIAKKQLDASFDVIKATYYVLDAQGNTISTYIYEKQNSTVQMNLTERHIYGSSRIGILTDSVDVISNSVAATDERIIKSGQRFYEMSNHLGNVLVVYRDLVNPITSTNGVEYQISLASVSDYSPFGVQLDGRTQSSSDYRYGFQGQEQDNEIKGEGNSYDYGNRMYDSRLGRWLSIDRLDEKYPGYSPYSSFVNSPLMFGDSKGDSVYIVTRGKNNKPVLTKITEDNMYSESISNALENFGTTVSVPIANALITDYINSEETNVYISMVPARESMDGDGADDSDGLEGFILPKDYTDGFINSEGIVDLPPTIKLGSPDDESQFKIEPDNLWNDIGVDTEKENYFMGIVDHRNIFLDGEPHTNTTSRGVLPITYFHEMLHIFYDQNFPEMDIEEEHRTMGMFGDNPKAPLKVFKDELQEIKE